MNTKTRVYVTLVLSLLLYNSETWTLKEVWKRRLLVFELGCLRRIVGVLRRDKMRNTDIRRKAGVEDDIVLEITRRRMRYFGHVVRMPQSRFPNMAMNECKDKGAEAAPE